MTRPGTGGCLSPSLCVFTRLAPNGCVALNRTRTRWPAARIRALIFLTHAAERHCDGPRRGSPSRSLSATPCSGARHRLKEHNRPLVAGSPSGPGAAPHSAVLEGTLRASEAGGRAGALAAVQPFAQAQARVVSRLADQAERPPGRPRARKRVTEQRGGAGGSREEGLARGGKPPLDTAAAAASHRPVTRCTTWSVCIAPFRLTALEKGNSHKLSSPHPP